MTDSHHELSYWQKYIFSQDHKVIGIQYAVTALLFLLIGFCLMLLMRWQLAHPGEALPLIGGLFSKSTMPGGVMLPEFYNSLGAMHGTIMVFLGVVPLAVGGVGKLYCSPSDRCRRYGISKTQYGQLLGLFFGWRDHAFKFFYSRRWRCPEWLDLLPPSG